MNLSDFIPPAFARGFAAARTVAKSAFAAAFIRGEDAESPLFGAGKMLFPYAQSTWVNRAIRLKVDEISRVPLKFYDGETEFTDRAFLDWWQAPFVTAAGAPMPLIEVRKQLASWPDLGGEFFILLGDDWLAPFASRRWQSLSRPIVARPERMRHVVQQGKIIGWVFTDAGNQQHALLPEQVIHSPEWHPYDDFRGLAAVKVVFNAAEADYLAGLYVRNLMRNNGDQGVFVIAKGGMPSDDQREQIVASLREKRAKALRGEFAPIFLTGDISVEDPKAEATDKDFNGGRILNREEIFSGLGVPPSMSQVKASYSLGADSDRFTLVTGSSMPLSAKVDAALSRVAALMTGRAIVAEADWDDHPVIQVVRRERVDTALKLWGVGMPMQQANAYLDLGMKPFAGWDQGYLPFSVAAIAPETSAPVVADPAIDPEFDEDRADEDDAMKSLRMLVLARAKQRQLACKRIEAETKRVEAGFSGFQCGCGLEAINDIEQRSDRPPAELAHWRTLMTQRRGTVKKFQSAIGRVLMGARVDVLKKIETFHKTAKSAEQKSGAAAHLLFDLTSFAFDFDRAMKNQQKDGLQTAGQQLFDELKRDEVFSYPPAEVIAYLHKRENKLTGVPQEVFDRVKAALEEGLQKGDTQAQLAGRVKAVFNDITDGQAVTIAHTETSAVYGAGRHQAMQQAGVQWKQWLTSGNANVRAAHAEANGQTVAIDEAFVVDGEELDYPGDAAGSAGNVINCHCVSIAVASGPKE